MNAKGNLFLTNRDFDILQFIFEQRVVAHHQLHTRFFGKAKRQTVHDRLGRLSHAGYLSKSYREEEGAPEVIYSSTDKGVSAFARRYRFEITNRNLKSDSIDHDIGLVEIRMALEKSKMMVDYYSENALQSCKALKESPDHGIYARTNSDAAMDLKVSSGQFVVALEYEVSEKEISRYAKKLTQYYLSKEVPAVFYICGSDRIERVLRQAECAVGDKFKPKMFTCLEKTIQKGIFPLPFMNRLNTTFNLE